MSTDKNTVQNPFVTFRAIALHTGFHPPAIPTPNIVGIRVALRPGIPPAYPPQLPLGQLIDASPDGRSLIDSSHGYHTVRPYKDVLADARLSSAELIRLYARGQTSESYDSNVNIGTKRQRTMVARNCMKESELLELPATFKVKRPMGWRYNDRIPPKRRRPLAKTNWIKRFGSLEQPKERKELVNRDLWATQRKIASRAEIHYVFIVSEQDTRMFTPADDMDVVHEHAPLVSVPTPMEWTPQLQAEVFPPDCIMASPQKPRSNFNPLVAVLSKPLDFGPTPRLPHFVFPGTNASAVNDLPMDDAGPTHAPLPPDPPHIPTQEFAGWAPPPPQPPQMPPPLPSRMPVPLLEVEMPDSLLQCEPQPPMPLPPQPQLPPQEPTSPHCPPLIQQPEEDSLVPDNLSQPRELESHVNGDRRRHPSRAFWIEYYIPRLIVLDRRKSARPEMVPTDLLDTPRRQRRRTPWGLWFAKTLCGPREPQQPAKPFPEPKPCPEDVPEELTYEEQLAASMVPPDVIRAHFQDGAERFLGQLGSFLGFDAHFEPEDPRPGTASSDSLDGLFEQLDGMNVTAPPVVALDEPAPTSTRLSGSSDEPSESLIIELSDDEDEDGEDFEADPACAEDSTLNTLGGVGLFRIQ
ncbi:hypothetical protein BC834DRAFT_1045456 [Gloeopeniophorella convolvens]|nr:hypothetical protein BC834DRAFT_1045456 [Gloeopeniophorella convolvens]